MSNEIEEMNVHLKIKVEERTRELQSSLDNVSKAIELGFFQYAGKKYHATHRSSNRKYCRRSSI
jgi:hypothetical protein